MTLTHVGVYELRSTRTGLRTALCGLDVPPEQIAHHADPTCPDCLRLAASAAQGLRDLLSEDGL